MAEFHCKTIISPRSPLFVEKSPSGISDRDLMKMEATSNYRFLCLTFSVDDVACEEPISGTGETSADPSAQPTAGPPPSVVISSSTALGKPITKPVTQSSTHVASKQSSRAPSPGSSNRQSPTPQDSEPAVPAEEKPAEVKPNASIFLQAANFLLEVNALQVKLY